MFEWQANPKKYPLWLVLAVGVLIVVFLGVTDYLTGPELSFSIFYLIPISLATLAAGKIPGFLISLVSAIVWLLADITSGGQYTKLLIPYWNGVVRFGYFSLHTYLLSILLKAIEREKAMALRDPLTNAANWRFFEEFANREIQRARRNKRPITIVYFDLDNFKTVNDTLGHDVGDDLLRAVSEITQGSLRPSDMLARVGGDEFALLLPSTDFSGADRVLNRVRENVIREMTAHGWPVTMSMGAVTFNTLPSTVGPMLKRADEVMYTVKRGGKNNIIHEQWPPSPSDEVGQASPESGVNQ